MLPMLTYSDRIFLAQKANSTHNTSYNLRQVLSDQENSNLEKADFRTAANYSFNPELNKMKKTRFSLSGLPGLLAKYDIEIED